MTDLVPSEQLLLPSEKPEGLRLVWVFVGLFGLAALAIVLIFVFWSRDDTEFAAVQKSCDVSHSRTRVADKGLTMVLDSKGEVADDEDVAVLVCVLSDLEVPEAVVAKMSDTSALDGRQEASWENYSASWTYHPKNGMDVIFQKK